MMLGRIVLLLILTISSIYSTPSFSQSYYSLLLDDNYSSRIGAENLLTLHKGITTSLDGLIKIKYFPENNVLRKTSGIFLRISRVLAIEYPLIKYGKSIQHEIFGHGAAVREFDRSATLRYTISHPYEHASSFTFFRSSRGLTDHERIAIDYSGSQANTILSNTLVCKCIQNSKIDFHSALFYFYTFHDLTRYILISQYRLPLQQRIYSGDIYSYLRRLNYHYGYYKTKKLELTELADEVLINFLNPFQAFCIYTIIKSYLWDGNTRGPLPMIKIGDFKYLPGLRYGLTPFGPEYYLENHFTYNSKMINLCYRRGNPAFENFWGVGVNLLSLITKQFFSMDMALNIWNQPRLYLFNRMPDNDDNSFGGSIFVTLHQRMESLPRLIYLTGQIGYKTAGFVEGEKLAKGLTIRFGISLQ